MVDNICVLRGMHYIPYICKIPRVQCYGVIGPSTVGTLFETYISCCLNSLHGVVSGIIQGTTIRVIEGDRLWPTWQPI